MFMNYDHNTENLSYKDGKLVLSDNQISAAVGFLDSSDLTISTDPDNLWNTNTTYISGFNIYSGYTLTDRNLFNKDTLILKFINSKKDYGYSYIGYQSPSNNMFKRVNNDLDFEEWAESACDKDVKCN